MTNHMNTRHPCFTRQRSTCFTKARFLWQRAAVLAGFFLCAAAISFAGPKPPLLIAYFVPSDRTPIPGYVDRLDRVMTEVQEFYRKGMEAAGYGPMTFDLAREQGGKLEVHLVRGKHPMRTYGRDDMTPKAGLAKWMPPAGFNCLSENWSLGLTNCACRRAIRTALPAVSPSNMWSARREFRT